MRTTLAGTAMIAVGTLIGWLASQGRFLNAVQAQEKGGSDPPLLKQINNGNWLDEAEAKSLVDELYYQRAVHVYMTMLPALRLYGTGVEFFDQTWKPDDVVKVK
jgi:hypothetical protein